jgi:sugar phosphate isomerase/epimerase
MVMNKRIQVHVPYEMLLERIDEALERAINPEVFLNSDILERADPSDLKMIKKEFGARDLRLTMHGPYMGLNPGGADELKRLKTVEVYLHTLDVASYLGPVSIVMHAGYDQALFGSDVEHWMNQSLKTWPVILKEAAKLDITIAAENIFEKNPETLKLLIEGVGSVHLRACLDSGHINLYSEVAPEVWLKELGPLIAELHLHDNNGKVDDHLPLGDGAIDFDSYFKAVKEYCTDPIYTIEPHGEDVLERALEGVRKYL